MEQEVGGSSPPNCTNPINSLMRIASRLPDNWEALGKAQAFAPLLCAAAATLALLWMLILPAWSARERQRRIVVVSSLTGGSWQLPAAVRPKRACQLIGADAVILFGPDAIHRGHYVFHQAFGKQGSANHHGRRGRRLNRWSASVLFEP